MTANDQGLISASFVGDETFHIAQVAYDVEIECDAIAAKNVARHPAHVARLDRATATRTSGKSDRIVVSRMISKVDLAINLDFSLKRKREPSIPRSFSDQ